MVDGCLIPQAGLGCSNFGELMGADAAYVLVQHALDAGVRFFDTADRYGQGESERVLGRALKQHRDEVIVATKFGRPLSEIAHSGGGGREWVSEAVEGSLRRLETDYIDLYQIHIPDADTPIEETLIALAALRDAGKIRMYGNSNFTAAQIEMAHQAAKGLEIDRFRTAQHPWSLLDRDVEADVAQACARNGVGIIAYSPLHSGILTGKYWPDEPYPQGSRLDVISAHYRARIAPPGILTRIPAFASFAEERGYTLPQVSLAWLLTRPEVVAVIPGATTPEQVDQNMAALDCTLSIEDLAILDTLAK